MADDATEELLGGDLRVADLDGAELRVACEKGAEPFIVDGGTAGEQRRRQIGEPTCLGDSELQELDGACLQRPVRGGGR